MSGDFKIGACALVFKNTVIGAVVNGPTLRVKSTYNDIVCSQTFDQPLGKNMRSSSVTLQADIREIETGMNMILDSWGRLTSAMLGQNVGKDGGELLLIPFNLNDRTGYRLPNAVLLKKTQYSYQEEYEHSMSLEFEAFMDGNGILLEKFIVNDSQRITMNTPEIDPAQIERTLTKYIAEKLELTVDQDIFRGGLPIGIDGCGVKFCGMQLVNQFESKKIHFDVIFKYIDRDETIKTMLSTENLFPAYGISVLLSEENINIKAILKEYMDIDDVEDNGNMKGRGKIKLTLIV